MEPLEINVIKEESEGFKSTALVLAGPLNLATCQELKLQFIKHLKKNDHLRIVIQEAEELDLAIIQLFYSFNKTAAITNKRVSIEAKLSNEQKIIIEKAGFNIINN